MVPCLNKAPSKSSSTRLLTKSTTQSSQPQSQHTDQLNQEQHDDNMCYWQFVTSDKCAMVFDPDLNRRRLRTKSEGFFDHGYWQKRTQGCARAQRRRAHCDMDNVPFPKYRDIVASSTAADNRLFMWDPQPHWTRDVNGQRVPDYRCERCRHKENRRSGH